MEALLESILCEETNVLTNEIRDTQKSNPPKQGGFSNFTLNKYTKVVNYVRCYLIRSGKRTKEREKTRIFLWRFN